MRYLVIFTLLISSAGFSQTQDANLWAGIGLKADIGDNWSAKYETQIRFNKNASTLQNYYNEISVDYKISKNFNVGGSYRYARKNRESYFRGENRLCLNLEFDTKITDLGFKLKSRARYQFAFDRLGVINDVIYPDLASTFRWKFQMQYKNKDFKRVSPFVGYEFFKAIQPAGVVGLDAYRIYAGIDFDLPARHEVGLKYIYELEHGSQQKVAHIYAIQYNYSLPSKLFKKKK